MYRRARMILPLEVNTHWRRRKKRHTRRNTDHKPLYFQGLAERVGFEPTLEFPLNTLSKRAPSTTRPPLLGMVFLEFNTGKERDQSRRTDWLASLEIVYLGASAGL